MPSAAEIPPGCPFHTRCPRFLGEQCMTQDPPWRETVGGHAYRCWIPPDDLTGMQKEVWETRAHAWDVQTVGVAERATLRPEPPDGGTARTNGGVEQPQPRVHD